MGQWRVKRPLGLLVERHDWLRFTLVGVAAYAGVLVVLLAVSLGRTDGTLVYALDDPAIHLSIADNLVHHGTWGVVPGEFQSASSSPLWTVLVALYQVLSPLPDSTGPLVMNTAAAAALLVLLGRTQKVLRPGRRSVPAAVAVAALVTFPLFLPALTIVGMEHILHMVLVVLAVALLARQWGSVERSWPGWLPYVVLAAAVMTRLETTFVAAAIGVALLTDGSRPLSLRLRRVLFVGLAAGLPLAVVSLWTKASGQGWLPNSVLAKVGTDTTAEHLGFVGAAYERLTADPLVPLVMVIAVVTLAARGERLRAHRLAAVVVLVTPMIHAAVARIGWYERYQAYLIALGVYLALGVGGELARSRPSIRPRVVPAAVLSVAILFCQVKVNLTREVPIAVEDTYAQRFQAGRFLARYYAGQPIATGELGYISLLHDGPFTDLYGLGDYDVLRERIDTDQQPSAAFWEALADERGFRVAAVYPRTLFLDTPDSWILVGTWTLSGRVVTAFEREFQFWATTPDEVEPLIAHLTDFASELPDRVTFEVNELARLRAEQLTDAAGG